MEEVKFIKLFFIVIFCLTFECHLMNATHHNYHKLRHFKHKIVHINDQHVNEIREAFEDYKKTVRKKVNINPNEDRVNFDFDDDITNDASDYSVQANEIVYDSQPKFLARLTSTRHKRVFTQDSILTTTTTMKSTAITTLDDDEEYFEKDEQQQDPQKIINNHQINDSLKNSSGGEKVHDDMRTSSNIRTLTEYKYETLGTQEGVRREFENEMKNQRKFMVNYPDRAKIIKLVQENILRTKNEGMCRWPSKKVVEMPHHTNKIYMPRKYVVYECSDDSACCGSSEKTCVAKTMQDVILWFNVRHFPKKSDVAPYESRLVQNHTECQCVRKTSLTGGIKNLNNDIINMEEQRPHAKKQKPKNLLCKCPYGFKAKVDDEENNSSDCMCICEHGNLECRQKHDGRELFSMRDQRCIKKKECEQPVCLYGTYDEMKGRCPTSKEKRERMRRGFHRPKK